MGHKVVTTRQRAFLAAYAASASVLKAAKAAQIDRSRHYTWMRDDPSYPEAFKRAQEEAGDVLESEAIARATKGVFEPLTHKGEFTYELEDEVDEEGEVIGTKRSDRPLGVWKKSDSLLMFLVKGFKPDKYRESWKGEISGPKGGPILVANEHLKNLNDEELAGFIALARKAAAPPSDGG